MRLAIFIKGINFLYYCFLLVYLLMMVWLLNLPEAKVACSRYLYEGFIDKYRERNPTPRVK